MPLSTTKQSDLITSAEVHEIQETLRNSCGGVLVVPFNDQVRLTPHLVPAKRSGEVDKKTLKHLAGRLRAIGCDKAIGVHATGYVRDILVD